MPGTDHMNSDEAAAVISSFWSWFVAHESELATVSSNADPALELLLQNLQRIHPDLYFEISTDSEPYELVVTVEGRRELFPLVDSVVSAAPQLDRWVAIALKPPMGFDFRTCYEGVSFDPRSMWFLPLESPSNPVALGLRVGISDFDPDREEINANAVRVVLDSVLGERSAASNIQHVEAGALPRDPEKHGYIELKDLPDYIEWRKQKQRRSS